MLWRCRLGFLLLGFFRGRKASHAMSHFSEPNSFTKPLFDQLKRHPKRIVFPEGEDERVLRVAARFVELGLGVPILLGDRCLLYTSDAADELCRVDLGGRRIIKKIFFF